jgi:hypothetical protein
MDPLNSIDPILQALSTDFLFCQIIYNLDNSSDVIDLILTCKTLVKRNKIYDYVTNFIDYKHINNPCSGCREDQPNQMAHMSPGGCLYDPEISGIWGL